MFKNYVFLGTLALSSVLAHEHEPSVTFYGDWDIGSTCPSAYVSLHHQSTLTFDDDVIILHALTSPHSHKMFHNELGVGYRKFFDNFGLGVNLVYANQNTFGFMNHQYSPGFEFFFDHFILSVNHYFHQKSGVLYKKAAYSFHDVSEATLSYRPSKKYEFSFTPLFNHNTRKFGYQGEISAYLFDNWKFSVIPHCEPFVRSGIAFSVGYHFGGAKGVDNQTLKKSHRFFYRTTAKKHVATKEHKVILAPPAPIFSPKPPLPIEEPEPEVIVKKTDSEPEVEIKTPEPKKDKERNWLDRLFFWRN